MRRHDGPGDTRDDHADDRQLAVVHRPEVDVVLGRREHGRAERDEQCVGEERAGDGDQRWRGRGRGPDGCRDAVGKSTLKRQSSCSMSVGGRYERVCRGTWEAYGWARLLFDGRKDDFGDAASSKGRTPDLRPAAAVLSAGHQLNGPRDPFRSGARRCRHGAPAPQRRACREAATARCSRTSAASPRSTRSRPMRLRLRCSSRSARSGSFAAVRPTGGGRSCSWPSSLRSCGAGRTPSPSSP